MKQLFTFLAVTIVIFFTANTYGQTASGNRVLGRGNAEPENYWHPALSAPSTSVMPFHPTRYVTYRLDEAPLRAQMFGLSSDPHEGIIIQLPMPDGTFRKFRVWQASMMPDELAAQFPDIKTFTGEAVDDGRVTAKLDFTVFGFHAMIFETDKTAFIDPYDHFHDGYYFAHYKKDEVRSFNERMRCEVRSPDENGPTSADQMEMLENHLPQLDHESHHSTLRTLNGWSLKTYRLALSADSMYCRYATGIVLPTIAQALSAMTTSMNRINGVYNREFSVQMNFVTNETLLIWGCAGHTNGNDPFAAINNNGGACLTQNQTTVTAIIGTANYDLGHVFTTGGGGISSLGVVCNNSAKAQSCTGSPTPVGDGYDIDYVAHEMGHEFGSNHTFNNNANGSCSGNAVSACAYEPGSGATIMDYAGICNPDDLQMHSDPYFSASSLVQIVNKLNGSENVCAAITPSGNHVDTLPHFSAVYSIPYKTPFELIGPASIDSTTIDTAKTYGWLQWNLGDFGKRLNQTFFAGPIFRSYNPVYTTTRIFPNINMVLSGVLSNAGIEGAEGEKAPDTARYLTFKLVARGIIFGRGCFHFPDDTIHLNAVQTPTRAGFKVTSQGTTGIVYVGGSTQTVTWNVVGTNAAPVNAANVDIYMSTDGGFTWPYTLGTFPNSGTASVTLPNPAVSSTTTRIKVKGNGNVFFNINSNNFTVNNNPLSVGPINGTFSICQGATTILTDGTTGGTWVSSNTGVATIGSGSGLLSGISAGTSTISYIAPGGTVTQVITVNPLPVVAPISGTSTVCIGGTTSLSDATGTGTWSSSNTAVATISAGGLVSGVAAGTSVISYTVTNSCGATVVTMTITVTTGAAVAPINGTMIICPGATTTLTDATSAGVWSSSNTGVATISAGGLVSGLSAGTTTISYSVTSGGCTSSATATFTVDAIPTAVISPAGTYTICASGSALFTVSSGAGYTYQWQDGLGNIPGETNASYTAIAAGTYRVIVNNSTGCSATSAYVTVVVGAGATVVPSVSISATPGTVICSSSLDTFSASSVNGGSSPTFQWYVNGVATGTGVTYSYVPADGDVVSVLLTSNASCASPDTASSSVVVTISPPVTPAVSITSIHGDTTCIGDTVRFAAVPVFGGTAPTYLWTKNGVNVATGPYYEYVPQDGDTLILTMQSNYPCLATNIAVSNIFIIHAFTPSVNNLSVTVSQSSVVAGSVVTFTAVTTGAGTSPSFQWYIDGLPVAGATSDTYVTDSLRNGQIVSCKETSSFACSNPQSVTSGGISISVVAVGIPVVGGLSTFTLLPNPNAGSFVIKGSLRSSADDKLNIVVTNMLGQTVYTRALTSSKGNVNERLEIGDLVPSGMYLVSVTSGDGRIVFHVAIDK